MPVWIGDYFEAAFVWLMKPDRYNRPSLAINNQMEPSSLRREKLTKILEHEAGNTPKIVAASIDIWDQASLPLARMIGRLGVASLFERCISLQAVHHPWLPHSTQAVLDDTLYTSVWESLRQQPPEVALATSIEIFSCFFELLSTLIGERLTMRVFLTGIPDETDDPKDQEVQS